MANEEIGPSPHFLCHFFPGVYSWLSGENYAAIPLPELPSYAPLSNPGQWATGAEIGAFPTGTFQDIEPKISPPFDNGLAKAPMGFLTQMKNTSKIQYSGNCVVHP